MEFIGPFGWRSGEKGMAIVLKCALFVMGNIETLNMTAIRSFVIVIGNYHTLLPFLSPAYQT